MTNEQQVARIIQEIKTSMARPGWKPQTSAELKVRADSRRDLVVACKINHIRTRLEYS